MASKEQSKGRPFDQLTQDGTGSAASVGPGGTGDIDRSVQQSGAGSQQSGGRTDDLLAGGTHEEARGFRSAGQSGELQTGMDGIGELAKGNRQSATGSGGAAQDKQEARRSDARITHKTDRNS